MKFVITGTSQGIGLEFTKQVLKDGHHVLAIARPSSHLQELRSLIEKYPKTLSLIEIDLAEEKVISLIESRVKEAGAVDVLINNAGVYGKSDSRDDFDQSFLVNSTIPYLLTQSLLPSLKQSSAPKLVLISSQMGSIQDASGGSYSYRASKAALNMMGKCFSLDHPWLTTLIFHPGWVQTNMGGGAAPVLPHDSVKGMLKLIYAAGAKDSGKYQTFEGARLNW